jgi:hypothetical protein
LLVVLSRTPGDIATGLPTFSRAGLKILTRLNHPRRHAHPHSNKTCQKCGPFFNNKKAGYNQGNVSDPLSRVCDYYQKVPVNNRIFFDNHQNVFDYNPKGCDHYRQGYYLDENVGDNNRKHFVNNKNVFDNNKNVFDNKQNVFDNKQNVFDNNKKPCDI